MNPIQNALRYLKHSNFKNQHENTKDKCYTIRNYIAYCSIIMKTVLFLLTTISKSKENYHLSPKYPFIIQIAMETQTFQQA